MIELFSKMAAGPPKEIFMKLPASVCGVVAVLAVVGVASGQEGEKRTIKQLTIFLIDAKTKGISEQTETKGTGIKQIEIQKGTVAEKVDGKGAACGFSAARNPDRFHHSAARLISRRPRT